MNELSKILIMLESSSSIQTQTLCLKEYYIYIETYFWDEMENYEDMANIPRDNCGNPIQPQKTFQLTW